MTATMLALRPYQAEGVEAAERAWARGIRRAAWVWPTGAGKTVGFAHVAARWVARHERTAVNRRRVLVLAHRTELIEQAASKLHDVAPNLRIGVVMGQKNQTLADVVVGSVQTLGGAYGERRLRQLLDVGLVVVDEAHHATAQSYLNVLGPLGCLPDRPQAWQSRQGGAGRAHGDAVALGVTATMMRGDDAALGEVWQDVVHSRGIAEMISDGFLVRPRGIRVRVDDLDLSKVKKSRGDYSEAALGAAITDSLAPEAVAKAYREHAADRPGILFAPTVASARVMSDALEGAGFTTALVHGEMPADQRRQALADFSAGKVQILCNCMVLTEGTDLPLASCAVIARPTTNAGLYIQMVGRVLRLSPQTGKGDALVLDVVGASQRHALVSPVELFGDELGELERRSCDCSDDRIADCPCGAVCSRDCPCGGGSTCGCPKSFEDLDEEQTLDGAIGDMGVDGPLRSEEVDLFHGSKSAWLRTYGGVWFIPAGHRYIAILPAPAAGEWDVVEMHCETVGKSSWIARGVADLSYAMAWAEGDVTASERMTAQRESTWRARQPSQNQRWLAQRNGVSVVDGELSGEVSNKITVALASRRIDPRVPVYARGR